MKNDKTPHQLALDRRQFLRGAASTVGATLLGLAPASVIAQGLGSGSGVSVGTGANPIVSIGYWDGTQLVPAAGLVSGDPTLDAIAINIDGRSAGSGFSSLDVQFPTDDSGTIAYSAWRSAPTGVAGATLTASVGTNRSLTITSHFGSGPGSSQVDSTLIMGGGNSPKLKAGTYVVTTGLVNWGTFPFNPSTYNGAQAGAPPFLVLTISPTE